MVACDRSREHGTGQISRGMEFSKCSLSRGVIVTTRPPHMCHLETSNSLRGIVCGARTVGFPVSVPRRCRGTGILPVGNRRLPSLQKSCRLEARGPHRQDACAAAPADRLRFLRRGSVQGDRGITRIATPSPQQQKGTYGCGRPLPDQFDLLSQYSGLASKRRLAKFRNRKTFNVQRSTSKGRIRAPTFDVLQSSAGPIASARARSVTRR